MGLDLILYKKNKNQNIEDISMEEELDSELAYGRKTWAIADFFRRRCKAIDEYEYEYLVTKKDWDAFIKNLDDLNNPSFRDKIDNYINAIHDYECNELTLEKVEDIMSSYNELEYWLDTALENDNGYTLGLDWELSAVLRWFDADSEVQEVFNNNDEEVRLIVSY